MRSANDLCWICQKNNNQIVQQWIYRLLKGRSCKATRKPFEAGRGTCTKTAAKQQKIPSPKCWIFPCGLKGIVHYSYNYAQQLHYPADPYQLRLLYFKTPSKCSFFGVCREAIPRQQEEVQTAQYRTCTTFCVKISTTEWWFTKMNGSSLNWMAHKLNDSSYIHWHTSKLNGKLPRWMDHIQIE